MNKYNSTPTMEDRYKDLESRVRTLETAPRLPASSIGTGGLTIKSGGNIVVEAGGQIRVLGGGGIFSYTNDGLGYARIENGQILFTFNETENPGYLLAALSPSGRTALWINPPNETGQETTYMILEGQSTESPGGAWLTSGGDILITPGDGFNTFIGHTTTSAAGNTYLNTNGGIQRSTSSLKYKRDIEEAHIDVECVLKLAPKTWRDKRQVEDDPETTQRYIGFIAEDLHEAGLTDFVVYENGEPDAISYDRLAAALIVVIKSHEERLKTLEETVNGGT